MPVPPDMPLTLDLGRLERVAQGEVILRLDGGEVYPADSYSVCQPAGAQWMPRAWVARPDGQDWLVRGDMVVVAFLRGSHRRVVVVGSVRDTLDRSGLARVPTDDPPRDALRLLLDFADFATGASPGSLDVQATGTGLTVQHTGALGLLAAGGVELGASGGQRLLDGRLVALLAGLAQELITVAAALAVPTPQTAAALAQLQADDGAGGGVVSTLLTRGA